MKKILSITFGLVLVFGLTGCEVEKNPAKLNPTICTMDAKGCPDGSFVGRTGPNCEFAECPKIEISDPNIIPENPAKNEIPKICTLEYEPVCGTPYFCLISKFAAGQIPAECTDGKTYGNKCNLESAKAIFKYNGECKNSRDFEPKQKACTKEYFPVCGEIDTGIRCIKAPCPSTEQKTFSNKCLAENAGAKIIYEGKCREKSENPAKSCTEGARKECIIMPDGNEACIADAIHVCKNGKWEIEGDFFFPEEIMPPLPPTENEIPKNCTNWFDGCNNCMVMPDRGLACTKMACFEQKEAYCTKFKE